VRQFCKRTLNLEHPPCMHVYALLHDKQPDVMTAPSSRYAGEFVPALTPGASQPLDGKGGIISMEGCLGCRGGDSRVEVPDAQACTFPFSAMGMRTPHLLSAGFSCAE